MSLAETGDNRLMRLGIVVGLEARIFVVNSMQPLLQFFLVTTCGRMDGVHNARLREVDGRQTNRMLSRRKSVVRMRVLEFCNASDVARMQHRHVYTLLPLRNGDVSHFLAESACRVVNLLTVAQRS